MENKAFLASVAQRAAIDNLSAVKLTEALCGVIADIAIAGNRLAIPGFGTFAGVKHEEQIVNDAETGKMLLMPPSITLEFSPSSMLKKSVKGGAK